jgi:hypothetical protein
VPYYDQELLRREPRLSGIGVYWEDATRMRPRNPRRLSLLFAGTTIILLLSVLLIITENNRKYSEALMRVVMQIVRTNQALGEVIQTATAEAFSNGLRMTRTAEMAGTQTAIPYDPTVYWLRETETWLLMTAGGPTDYAIFYATGTALVATGRPTATPSP